MQQAHP